jgi:hypothetical protein
MQKIYIFVCSIFPLLQNGVLHDLHTVKLTVRPIHASMNACNIYCIKLSSMWLAMYCFLRRNGIKKEAYTSDSEFTLTAYSYFHQQLMQIWICRQKNLWITYIEFFLTQSILLGARGSIVGWGTMLQAGRSRVLFPMRSLDFSFDAILPAALWPWCRLDL